MLSTRPKLRGGSGDFEPVSEGVYTLQILDVDAVSWEYKGEKKDGFNFKLAILDDEELPESGASTRGRFLWYRVSDAISKRSNLYKLASAAFGRQLTNEETDPDSEECLNPNDLVGKQVMGVVVNNVDNDGRTWNNIESVSRVKTKLKPIDYKVEEPTVTKTETKPVKKAEPVKSKKEEEEMDDEELDKILEEDDAFEDEEEEEEEEEAEEEAEDEDDDDEAELEKLRKATEAAEKRLAAKKAALKSKKKILKK